MSAKRILTLSFGVLALLLAYFALTIGVTVGATRAVGATGWDWLTYLSPSLLLLWLIIFLPARWRAIPVRWRLVGSAEIDAPVDRIWALLVPRPGQPYHANSVVRIEAAAEDPNRVRLHFDDALADSGEAAGPVIETVIAEQDRGKRLVLRYLNPEILPLMGRDVLASETLIEPAEGGRYKVTFIEHMRAFRLSSLLFFLHLNACTDGAERLKALCEGTTDRSWMGTNMYDLRDNPSGSLTGGAGEFVAAAIIVAVGISALLFGFTLLV